MLSRRRLDEHAGHPVAVPIRPIAAKTVHLTIAAARWPLEFDSGICESGAPIPRNIFFIPNSFWQIGPVSRARLGQIWVSGTSVPILEAPDGTIWIRIGVPLGRIPESAQTVPNQQYP